MEDILELVNPFKDGEVMTEEKFGVVVDKLNEVIRKVNGTEPPGPYDPKTDYELNEDGVRVYTDRALQAFSEYPFETWTDTSDVMHFGDGDASDFPAYALTDNPLVSVKALYGIGTTRSSVNNICRGATNLVAVYCRYWSNASLIRTFESCSSLKILEGLDGNAWTTTNFVSIQYTFSGCSSLTNLDDVGYLHSTGATSLSDFIKSCSNLESIDLRNIKVSNPPASNTWMNVCPKLVSLIGTSTSDNEVVVEGITHSFTLASDTSLNRISLRALFRGLANLSGGTQQTITLNSTLRGIVTDEDKLIATAKNWVVN